MNDTPNTARQNDAGSARDLPENPDEDPSPSTVTGSQPHEATPAGPGLVQKFKALFRPRNGTNLREEIVDALAETGADGEAFSPGERAMLNNILRLREVRVEDVMVPRADIEAVELGTTLADLMTVFEQSGHSRMPVYCETLDDPRGMVHIRDLLGHITRLARGKKRRTSLMRPVLFVPPSMLASDLMGRMQAARIQMALVIDEYGGTDGLASLEDIVEMVVGDIEDEHDDEEALITKAGDGVFIVDGKAEIEDVQAMIGEDFAPGEHGESVDTIGGMIFNTLGRVPARGEVVQAIPGFEFHVLDADPRRIKRVRIVQLSKGERRKRVIRAEQA
jgi:CBS domain containing-hemolysin-like protein